jgi:hypothetical protein
MLTHIPSLAALESPDDRWLDAELRLADLRAQLVAICALTDHIDRLARPENAHRLGEQTIREMGRLGCRLLEAAASQARMPRAEASGVFVRPSPSDSAARRHLGSTSTRQRRPARHSH